MGWMDITVKKFREVLVVCYLSDLLHDIPKALYESKAYIER